MLFARRALIQVSHFLLPPGFLQQAFGTRHATQTVNQSNSDHPFRIARADLGGTGRPVASRRIRDTPIDDGIGDQLATFRREDQRD
ncbi:MULTISPECIES: hypothetical protein [unclassified Methylobacterium]|uniref:hypothetical protein n=1 Tax=unclassified Methylobacterium TaxID=2615210 RepID=UPI001FED2FB7|nr:hypothetical protein [Methylobacterium sp. 2A]